jgi:hypothetical protein
MIQIPENFDFFLEAVELLQIGIEGILGEDLSGEPLAVLKADEFIDNSRTSLTQPAEGLELLMEAGLIDVSGQLFDPHAGQAGKLDEEVDFVALLI